MAEEGPSGRGLPELSSASGVQPADGWAVSVVRASGRQLVGDSGSHVGVPRDRDGYALEWRVYTGDDTDVVTLRHLSSAGNDDVLGFPDTVSTTDAFDRNDAADDKGLRIYTQPEDPRLPWEKTAIRAYWVNSGIEHAVAFCGGDDRSIGYVPWPVTVLPGDQLVMIVSAGSGSLTMNVDNIRMRVDGERACYP